MIRKICLIAFLLFVSVGIILTAIAYAQLAGMVNIHMSPYAGSPGTYGLPFEEVSLNSADKTTLSAWYIHAPRPRGLVILVHGYSNPGGKATMLGHAQYLYQAGYSSLLLDLGGFGKSSRPQITLGIKEADDVAAAYSYIKSLSENRNIPVGFLGYSMGGASVINAAGNKRIGEFVIELDSYRSIDSLLSVELTKRGIPALFALPFMQLSGNLLLGMNYNSFSPENFINNIRVPILIIHGKMDTAVPIEQGNYLFAKANEPKAMVILNTTHDVFTEDPDGVKKAVLQFLKTLTE